jgi:DNA-binding ferritin-like protein (Dps family)
MLPFKVSPKTFETIEIGNEDAGVLEIKKLNDLSPLERRYIKAQGLLDMQKAIAAIAKQISREAGEKFAYAYDRIAAYLWSGTVVGDTVKILNHKQLKDQQLEVIEIEIVEGKKTLTVSAADKSVKIPEVDTEVVDPEWFGEFFTAINELQDCILASLEEKKFVYVAAILKHRLSDETTVEQVMNPEFIHPKLVELLYEFALLEERGGKEPETEQPQASTDEEVGKS